MAAEYQVLRFSSQKNDTLGLLFEVTDNVRKFLAFTVEDEYREEKVWGETRIPAGRYKLGLRKVGKFHKDYSKQYPEMHKGMIQVLDVPNFEYILFHTGNTEKHTAGCLIVGDSAKQNITKDGFVGASRNCYKRIYPGIAAAIEAGDAFVTYVDWD